MRILIVGAVAAGTSAAAKARRNDESAEITIYEKDSYISYSGCGMPYFLSGELKDFSVLVPRDAAFFKKKYNIDILTGHEVLRIDPGQKKLIVQRLADQSVFEDFYDVLVLATGASPIQLSVPGASLPNVFQLRNIGHMLAISQFMTSHQPWRAVIIGSGFVGLEMAESLTHAGKAVTLLEKQPQLNPGMDADMAAYIGRHLDEKGVTWLTSAEVIAVAGEELATGVVLADGRTIAADLVLVAVGVRPNTALAVEAGVKLGRTGAISVDTRFRTSVPNIYACGDCAESFSIIDGQPLYVPLGSTANKAGRIVGDAITSSSALAFRGIAGTGIFRLFDLTVARTGMTEREATAKGIDVIVIHNIKPDRPEYMGGRDMVIKAVADRTSGLLLGAQIIGYAGVDKRIDVLVTALSFKAHAADLFHLDLAYAPPFATTRDPVMYTGMILDDAISQGRALITANQLDNSRESLTILDARSREQYEQGHIPGAISMPQDEIRQRLQELSPDQDIVTYCNRGVTGNAAQNILIGHGFRKIHNLSGGHKNYLIQKALKSAGKKQQ
jgi:NADPH-dependent 2,4-dienoyl-CoA reductase/sulfur reductase-like enzyme/rhodanese-related sulfurtransferase